MHIITQPNRSTDNKFICLVKRSESKMRYQDTDGKWVPLQSLKWELWTVKADTQALAMKEANYHFYSSRRNEILIGEYPITKHN